MTSGDDTGFERSRWLRFKDVVLGPPLRVADLPQEKLSNRAALGVLASDGLSSTAYGGEQMLRVLVPVVGTAAFSLLLPLTGALLLVLLVLTITYGDVVTHYTRAGGSYVVAKENFGPRVAQIAAVALLVDYIVTVAVQAAAGADALISLVHLIGDGWPGINAVKLPVTVAIVLVLAYGNLRGVRQAGRVFAVPAYLFVAAVTAMLLVGLWRAATGGLPRADTHAEGALELGTSGDGLLYGATVFVVLRAFANGGASLTGLEAVSNSVSVFREPRGVNARRTLVVMSLLLAGMIGTVAWLAAVTHPVPFTDGSPTVIAQEAHMVFGDGVLGVAALVFVQVATALILFTGANTPFSGFPFLADFVAEDRFLPLRLTRRGQRLAYSGGIIALTVVSVALLVVTGAQVEHLVALYAIGVFTGFAMAGAGMAVHHRRERGPRHRLRTFGNAVAAVVSAAVVLIFAVTKFTEGAWLVVLVFPAGVWTLIRINREYREEAAALRAVERHGADLPTWRRHVVLVLVDALDLAALRALRYAHTLHPDELRAVHVALDPVRAERLRRRWADSSTTSVPLRVLDCQDRRLAAAVARTAVAETADGETALTLLLPRRLYLTRWGKLLHPHQGERIARAVEHLPATAVTILPVDVGSTARRVRAIKR
ncbi:amino acid permease [Streptomyces sp. 3MP-14]|uniref:Amino acid permease n=1 Tax=Streptomyces mimosae TaxID=2586635 RepID=A0A5N5ZTK2_9ACTN|nr:MULTISPECIES: APC family permease [Streptomyces]KAB8159565.1 amino acid permease [Streptomyces mimosae]KAB8172843.1 amino acid permease [Streptomyces sp. 3MP-14]